MNVRSAILSLMTLTACAEEPLVWTTLPPLPDRLGVAAPFAGVANGALLVGGGANFPDRMPWEGGKKVWHDTVWALPQPDGPWQVAGKLPRPLGYGVSVTHDDSVVCVGGSDAERHHADGFRLRWQDGKLHMEALPALPIPLSGAAFALVGSTLHVAGGSSEPGEQSATNRAFALDLDQPSARWRELPALPGKARLLAVGAAHEDAFFVFGGAALEARNDGKLARVYLREAWRYRDSDGWKRLAHLPKPSVAAPSPAPLLGGRLHLIAGDDGSRVGFQTPTEHPGFPRAILSYDPKLDQWSEAGETPAPRATVPTVEWRGRVIIPSGEVRPGVRSPEIWSVEVRE